MTIDLPSGFVEYLTGVLGDEARRFLEGLPSDRKTTLRVNTLKTDPKRLITDLERSGYRFRPLDTVEHAFIVEEEPTPISKTLLHFLGHFYIQSVASMLPPLVLAPGENETILDISAAPGSKTTQLGLLMKNCGRLVANEWDGKRIKTLSHNLDRMGVWNAAMVNMGGERLGNLIPETFDRILVDAPCSAIGVVHKAPEAMGNLRHLGRFTFVQEQLLVSAVKAARVGGMIVYSTCTVTPEENEVLLDRILGRYPIEIEPFELHPSVPTVPGLSSRSGGPLHPGLANARRVFPSNVNPEGFFIARLRKKDAVPIPEGKEPFPNKHAYFRLIDASHPDIRAMAEYFGKTFGMDPEGWREFLFMIKGDEIFLTSRDWLGREGFLNRIFTHRIGMRLARSRRAGEWKLSTNAAQSFADRITKGRIELSDSKEIETFVSAGTIRRPFEVERGGVVVLAHGRVLGCGVMTRDGLKSQMPKSRMVIGINHQ
jgi:16S rRNA (cytosine1407-C5)-methyltransferase